MSDSDNIPIFCPDGVCQVPERPSELLLLDQILDLQKKLDEASAKKELAQQLAEKVERLEYQLKDYQDEEKRKGDSLELERKELLSVLARINSAVVVVSTLFPEHSHVDPFAFKTILDVILMVGTIVFAVGKADLDTQVHRCELQLHPQVEETRRNIENFHRRFSSELDQLKNLSTRMIVQTIRQQDLAESSGEKSPKN